MAFLSDLIKVMLYRIVVVAFFLKPEQNLEERISTNKMEGRELVGV